MAPKTSEVGCDDFRARVVRRTPRAEPAGGSEGSVGISGAGEGGSGCEGVSGGMEVGGSGDSLGIGVDGAGVGDDLGGGVFSRLTADTGCGPGDSRMLSTAGDRDSSTTPCGGEGVAILALGAPTARRI